MANRDDIPQPAAAPARTPKTAKPLSPAAERALAEAEARRAGCNPAQEQPQELGGRGGFDPVRYGDWEIKGITSDF